MTSSAMPPCSRGYGRHWASRIGLPVCRGRGVPLSTSGSKSSRTRTRLVNPRDWVVMSLGLRAAGFLLQVRLLSTIPFDTLKIERLHIHSKAPAFGMVRILIDCFPVCDFLRALSLKT